MTAVERACKAAGATILPNSISLNRPHPVGTTIATGTMQVVAQRHGERVLIRALKILIAAKRGPIKAGEIAAVALMLTGIDERLSAVIGSRSAEEWASRTDDGIEPKAQALASEWYVALAGRTKEARTSTRRRPQEATSTPAAPPRPEPRPPPPERIPALPPAPAPPAAPSGETVHNGIAVDLGAGTIRHRKRTIMLGREEGVKLIAALAAVMPSLMDHRRLAEKLFGQNSLAEPQLRDLIAAINPLLREAGLEVRSMKNFGHSLYDLGAA